MIVYVHTVLPKNPLPLTERVRGLRGAGGDHPGQQQMQNLQGEEDSQGEEDYRGDH